MDMDWSLLDVEEGLLQWHSFTCCAFAIAHGKPMGALGWA
eukprot:CAMPEP_0172897400 /NCGR_PEP_ID=MMETSP1075-20121228/157466_1 /TAXON_ID=2916 /ORGANISM="Ceratium fusus, Strain PA161109" /LENGTH=39 /DNA_ID= /DNA_START= /DNA_END= /DNA_ORIENTATION=